VESRSLLLAGGVAVAALSALAVALPPRRAADPAPPGGLSGDVVLMRAAPMAGRATADSIELGLLTAERPLSLRLRLEPEGGGAARGVAFAALTQEAQPVARFAARGALGAGEGDAPPLEVPAQALVELSVAGLGAGSAWRWQLDFAESQAGERQAAAVRRGVARGRFVTTRPRGASFTFAVFSDTHVFPASIEPELPPEIALDERVLDYAMDNLFWYRTTRERVADEAAAVFAKMGADRPDFAVSLGDVFDLHGRGFNWAFTTQELADAAHLEARRTLGGLHDCGALFQALGNWEGESGCHPAAQRELAKRARLRHEMNPRPTTSPWGGSADEDYFAFEWGDLLGVVLNVRGYTPTAHHMDPSEKNPGAADDFTLGVEQKKYLEASLAKGDHAYKALFLHHVVGGNGGNPFDTAYGRGGGRAAKVGEQAWVHELCRKHGVQVIFYGHDHVFTDMVVDDVHYTLPGTTSAPWRFSPEETGYEQSWPDSGYARVTVAPEQMGVELVSLSGAVLHSYAVAPRAK